MLGGDRLHLPGVIDDSLDLGFVADDTLIVAEPLHIDIPKIGYLGDIKVFKSCQEAIPLAHHDLSVQATHKDHSRHHLQVASVGLGSLARFNVQHDLYSLYL